MSVLNQFLGEILSHGKLGIEEPTRLGGSLPLAESVAQVAADMQAYSVRAAEFRAALFALPRVPPLRTDSKRRVLHRKVVATQNVVKALEALRWALSHEEGQP